jgi:hypothetical protein
MWSHPDIPNLPLRSDLGAMGLVHIVWFDALDYLPRTRHGGGRGRMGETPEYGPTPIWRTGE